MHSLVSYAVMHAFGEILEFSTIEMFSDFYHFSDNFVNFGSDCDARGIRVCTEKKGYVLASLSRGS